MKKVSFFLFVLFLSSCTCNYHLNRAKLKCGYSFKSDTIYKKDTVLISSVETHTVFHYNQKDTVIVKEGRLTMKYFYNDSTVYLSGKCDTIFIVKDIPVAVNNTEIKESNPWYLWVIIFLLLIILIKMLWKKV